MQHVHPEYRFVRFIEGWEELREHRRAHGGDAMPLGTHYLPHDALHERQGSTSRTSLLPTCRSFGRAGTSMSCRRSKS